MSHTVQAEKNTSKKIKAILAGGVVLGVGAAVTLAAWTDQEWASAEFSSGSFTLESSTSTVYDEESFNSSSNPGELDFEMPQASQLGPNEQVAAPVSLRLDEKTTHNANVTMSAGVTGEIEGLSYEVIHVETPEQCATSLSEGARTALGQTPKAMPAIELAAGEKDNAGRPYTLCFIVSASDELLENQFASASWTFDAESLEN